MNDRALREIVNSLGGAANGYPREDGFDITVASEVMAIFCLASDLNDLRRRLGNIIVGYTRDKKPVRASDLKAQGAMTALLKDALAPNLVQTLEGTPAFIHGGPFANIAHGCNSVLATTTALKLADYVVTEAGFGADLGGEKFLDIKCRKAGLEPACVVLVATIRALKMHGGVKKDDLKKEDLAALDTGMSNLRRHVENIRKFGLEPVISINRFSADSAAEIELVKSACAAARRRVPHGGPLGDGRRRRHRRWRTRWSASPTRAPGKLKFIYPDDMPLFEKIRTIAREIYRAKDVTADKAVKDQLDRVRSAGLRHGADLRRQDAVQLLDQSRCQGRAGRSHDQRARGPALGGSGVRGRDLRRDHDDAGPAEGAGGGIDRRRARTAGSSDCSSSVACSAAGRGRLQSCPISVVLPRLRRGVTLSQWVLPAASSLASPARADRSTACGCSQMLRGTDIETHLVMSRWGARTLVHETGYTPEQVQALADVVASAHRSGRGDLERVVRHDGHGDRAVQRAHARRDRPRARRSPRAPRRRRRAEGAPQARARGARSAAATRFISRTC